MPESGFQPHQQISLTTLTTIRPRDSSPDSVIFTLESNFSLLSSASASVGRCSFASVAYDQDAFDSELSLDLTEHDGDFAHKKSWSGPGSDPDPDPNKLSDAAQSNNQKHSLFSTKRDKAEGRKEGNCYADFEDGNKLLGSASSSFSLALKECQDRRRSEASNKKRDRSRPASLDLNNASPRLGVMKKGSAYSRRSGALPSSGTPNYGQGGITMQKGWCSERVPLHTNASRKHLGAAILPLNSGRTLPSKWEDAERWIFSPVSGDGSRSAVQPPQRRPKSKSGPLGPPGLAYYSFYSPAIPLFERGPLHTNFLAGSPFSAGVIPADTFSLHCSEHAAVLPARTDPCMARSASVHGCAEMQNEPSLPVCQDENFNGVKDAVTDVSHAVSRRNKATQMSPEGSPSSSPKRSRSFFASKPSTYPMVELESVPSSKLEVRDVQVDERATLTRWSKKSKTRLSGGQGYEFVDNWKNKGADAQSSTWDISETAKSISKTKRDEAKITAWENLQKAKAETAIRKLEMKLEKKRSSSMDKIMNKLRSAQKKAQEMRSSALVNQSHQVTRTSHKATSSRRTRQMGSLSGCFTCHAS